MSSDYRVGIYIRISKEDLKEGKIVDSESVKNQRLLLTNYVRESNYELFDEYVDDGYSGSNFDRPSFKRLLSDIENKKINMVVVKDLSRLGRNNIETNEYLERYFPLKNIRFVALLDDVDTKYDTYGNEMAPFKIFINSYYNKETSKKIKTTLRNKKKSGLYTGWKAPYGYIKNPIDHYRLIVDENVRYVIEMIFNLAVQGKTSNKIAEILSKEKIPTPKSYANLGNDQIINYSWSYKTIDDILSNPVYVGHLAQGKRKKLYGIKKEIKVDSKDWIIAENTHDAIIDFKTFERVQNRKKKIKNSCSNYLLSDFLICKECNHKINILKNRNRKQAYTSCSYYRKYSRLNLCTAHTMNYKKLEENILNEIRKKFELYIDKKTLLITLSNKTKVEFDESINQFIMEKLSLRNIDNQFLKKIINKIVIDKNKRVEVYLKFKV